MRHRQGRGGTGASGCGEAFQARVGQWVDASGRIVHRAREGCDVKKNKKKKKEKEREHMRG